MAVGSHPCFDAVDEQVSRVRELLIEEEFALEIRRDLKRRDVQLNAGGWRWQRDERRDGLLALVGEHGFVDDVPRLRRAGENPSPNELHLAVQQRIAA